MLPKGVHDNQVVSFVLNHKKVYFIIIFIIQHIKTKMEEDMRTTQSESGAVAEGDLARRNAERRLFGSLGPQSDRIRQEMQRYASMRDPTLR